MCTQSVLKEYTSDFYLGIYTTLIDFAENPNILNGHFL